MGRADVGGAQVGLNNAKSNMAMVGRIVSVCVREFVIGTGRHPNDS